MPAINAAGTGIFQLIRTACKYYGYRRSQALYRQEDSKPGLSSKQLKQPAKRAPAAMALQHTAHPVHYSIYLHLCSSPAWIPTGVACMTDSPRKQQAHLHQCAGGPAPRHSRNTKGMTRATGSPMESQTLPPPACGGRLPAPPAPSGHARSASAGCWCPAPQRGGSDLQGRVWTQVSRDCQSCLVSDLQGDSRNGICLRSCMPMHSLRESNSTGQHRQGPLPWPPAARDSNAEACRAGLDVCPNREGLHIISGLLVVRV